MQTQVSDAYVILLDRYYQAHEENSVVILEEILASLKGHVRGLLLREGCLAAEMPDLYQEAMIALAQGLRASRKGTPIRNLSCWVRTVVSHLVIDTKRRGTPERQMTQQVLYIVTISRYKERYARWMLRITWMIGLSSWEGQDFIATQRYLDFCQDDTAFVQQALNGRNPAMAQQIKLWELLFNLLEWIETPLAEKQLVKHLLRLRPATQQREVSIDNPAFLEPASSDSDPALDWDRCRQAICRLPRNARTTLLLGLDPELLVVLTALPDPRPYLAEILGLTEEQVAAIWKCLPLADEEIARRLQTSVSNVQTIRSRSRAHLCKQGSMPVRL